MIRTLYAALLVALPLAAPAAAQSVSLPEFDPANPPRLDATPLVAGPTAFNEAQARRWLLRAGLSNITELSLGDDGVWTATVERAGITMNVGLDAAGSIATR